MTPRILRLWGMLQRRDKHYQPQAALHRRWTWRSGDAEGGPGATGGGAGNSEHDVPKDPSTPVSTRPFLRHKRRTKPNPKYNNFILNTRLPFRDLTRKEQDILTIPDGSRGPSGAASGTGSASTTASHTKTQAGIVFDNMDAKLIRLAEQI